MLATIPCAYNKQVMGELCSTTNIEDKHVVTAAAATLLSDFCISLKPRAIQGAAYQTEEFANERQWAEKILSALPPDIIDRLKTDKDFRKDLLLMLCQEIITSGLRFRSVANECHALIQDTNKLIHRRLGRVLMLLKPFNIKMIRKYQKKLISRLPTHK